MAFDLNMYLNEKPSFKLEVSMKELYMSNSRILISCGHKFEARAVLRKDGLWDTKIRTMGGDWRDWQGVNCESTNAKEALNLTDMCLDRIVG